MKIIVWAAYLLVLLGASNFVLAASEAQEDEEQFQALFLATEMSAPSMRQCGMTKNVQTMISTLSFLDLAYSRLNDSFQRADPPVVEQIEQRIETVCEALQCKRPPQRDKCESTKRMAQINMKRFSRVVKEADRRLAKAGLTQKIGGDVAPKVSNCPLSPQQYEDAYRKSFRVDDMICMQESLKRFYGLK